MTDGKSAAAKGSAAPNLGQYFSEGVIRAEDRGVEFLSMPHIPANPAQLVPELWTRTAGRDAEGEIYLPVDFLPHNEAKGAAVLGIFAGEHAHFLYGALFMRYSFFRNLIPERLDRIQYQSLHEGVKAAFEKAAQAAQAVQIVEAAKQWAGAAHDEPSMKAKAKG